ncbi:MAG: hypothetical protein ABEH59_09815 [Halobacteriales archaeon]
MYAAQSHGLETGVEQGQATVRVHRNGSATWTVRVVPTNDSVLARLAGNRSLARAVTEDSYGTRYGGGIPHEFIDAAVADGAFVMRYRTNDVVEGGPFGTQVLTYFRDAPGAWVYTDLGADEITVVAPDGMTVARGFGDVSDDRMTATGLPDVRNGPFVVFAPAASPFPGLVGSLAVIEALAGVIVRNLVAFVALPGGVLIGGFAALRRWVSPEKTWKPTRIGSLVAAGGGLVVIGSLVVESDVLPTLTGNLLLGLFAGTLLLILGGVVAIERVRTHLTAPRMLGFGLGVGVMAHFVTKGTVGAGGFHQSLAFGAAVLPIAVGFGWLDGAAAGGSSRSENRIFLAFVGLVLAALVASAPLTALGGSLFLLVPILLTAAAVGVVALAIPLYLLGVVGANAQGTTE